MMHVSLYHDILVSAVAYDPDTDDPRVHIDVCNAESKFSTRDRIAYLDITLAQARKLAEELLAAAACCKGQPFPSAQELVQQEEQRKRENDQIIRYAFGLPINKDRDDTAEDV